MNEIQIFNNPDFGEVRTLIRDGEPWFIASDICKSLDVGNMSQAISRLDEDEKDIILNDTPGGVQKMAIINEPGLYALVLSSRKPDAKAFKRWVTHEVIPSIRKTGSYSTINRESLSPTLQMVYAIADNNAALELRQKQLEKRQDDQDAKVAYFGEKISNMKEIFLQPVGDWKEDINKRVREIAIKAYSGDYQKVFTEMYAQLEIEANTNLSRRCENKRIRMEKAGNTKDTIKKATTKLAIIYDDKKLRAIFELIVKKWAMSYCA